MTHIPFGHTLEDETGVIDSRHDEDPDRLKELLLESRLGTVLRQEIGSDGLDLLVAIMSAKGEEVPKLGEYAFVSDIVSNTVCADLLDYLKRDVYFCNLQEKFGDRFRRYLYLDDVKLGNGPNARRLIVRLWKDNEGWKRRDVLSELVALLRVRYSLGEKVYFHHAKLSSSAMISRAVWSAMSRNLSTPLLPRDLWSLGVDQLLERLENSEDPLASRLAGRLLRRHLYKRAYSLSLSEASAVPNEMWPERMVREFQSDAPNRTRVEDELADLCEAEPGEILVYCPPLEMAKKYARMLVAWKGEVMPLENLPDEAAQLGLDAILKSHDLLWSLHVFISPDIANDVKRKRLVQDLCRWRFGAAVDEDDRRRQLELTLTMMVNERFGDRGNAAQCSKVVEEVLMNQRGGARASPRGE